MGERGIDVGYSRRNGVPHSISQLIGDEGYGDVKDVYVHKNHEKQKEGEGKSKRRFILIKSINLACPSARSDDIFHRNVNRTAALALQSIRLHQVRKG